MISTLRLKNRLSRLEKATAKPSSVDINEIIQAAVAKLPIEDQELFGEHELIEVYALDKRLWERFEEALAAAYEDANIPVWLNGLDLLL